MEELSEEIRIRKNPEENKGIAVTGSDYFQISWIWENGKLFEIGKARFGRDRLHGRRELYIPREEYDEHVRLAKSALSNWRQQEARRKQQARFDT